MKCGPAWFTQMKPDSMRAAARWAAARLVVHTDAVSPYSTRFTCSSIASSSLQRSTASTGPNTSSLAMRMSCVTPVKIVGSTNQPPASFGSVGRPPPHASVAPSPFATPM